MGRAALCKPVPTSSPAGIGPRGCCGSPAFVPLAGKAQKQLRTSKARERHASAWCLSPKTIILADKNTLAKLYRVPSVNRWGWGEKNKKAAEAEEEEFNISICSYPNKLRCICGSVRGARRNETIK